MSEVAAANLVTGISVFDGHKRMFFTPSCQSSVRFQGLMARNCPHQEFRQAKQEDVDAWRPDGWTKEDEKRFREWKH